MAPIGGSIAKTKLTNAKTLLSAAASFAATALVVRSVVKEFLPSDFNKYMFLGIKNYLNYFSSQLTMVINEMDGLVTNKIYEAAETYLATKISPTTKRLKVCKPEKEGNITTTIESGEEVIDIFNGVELHWVFISDPVETDHDSSNRVMDKSFELSFHKKHREMVIESYLPYIVQQAEKLKQQIRTLKIFTVRAYNNIWYENSWISTNLDHPSTFDNLAMDFEMKDFILKDLERFVKRKEFYKTVGKAWKRGYLLYGPPGTGKSSLIAAIANYLKFNVYDLELTELKCNSDLRKLLMGMENRSILVVEDIDCTIEFKDRESKDETSSRKKESSVTLSGMLNFIDGLWSSCGNERIIIFTTNHKEKLDPALLRPGRMDVHVNMSYCSPCGFRLLASNYLGIKDHKLFCEIEETILNAKVTPAMIAEELLKADDDPDNALNDLLEFLRVKKIENEEADQPKILKTEFEDNEKWEKKQEKNGDENATAAAA